MNDLCLKQGLLAFNTHKIDGKILSVIYEPTEKLCTVLHANGLCIFQDQNLKKTVRTAINFQWILHVDHFELLVGIQRNAIHLLACDYEPFYEAHSKKSIECCIYNSFSNNIITAGLGYITLWAFHQGGKTLTISETITDGLSEYDKVTIIHLEDVPGTAQRCFAAVGNSIKVYHLYSGRLLKDVSAIHSRNISAVLFFRPLQYLITAARDGSIKVWDSSWNLYCSFIGHEGPVTGLSPYSTGPYIISSSLDSTMQLWDLRLCDTLQTISHSTPALGVFSLPSHPIVVSYSNKLLKMWHINKLYHKTTIIGCSCFHLSSTVHPFISLRIISLCADSTVRLISPVGGAIITTALLPLPSKIISAAYKPLKETLYTLCDNSTITVFNSHTNPCTKTTIWDSTDSRTIGTYTYLALYEFTLDTEEIADLLEHNVWLSVVVEAQKSSRTMEDPLRKEKEGIYLLLVGTDKGIIGVIDETTGGMLYHVRNPDRSYIVNITCNPKMNNIIAVSKANMITIWRVYPYSNRDALVMMMSFDPMGSPTHLSVLLDRLCVAVDNHDKACYPLTMYSLPDLTCYSSNPVHNHTECITGLDVNIYLHVFVSCAKDCTVRLWSKDNNLLRILQLESIPTAVCFSSSHGNLMISMKNVLYTVTNTSYLTQYYIKQLVTLGNEENISESPRDIDMSIELTDDDVKRLFPSDDDEFQEVAYRGALSQAELDELDRKAAAKYDAIQLLLEREKDMKAIRDGSKYIDKVPSLLNAAQRNQVWKHVLSLFQPLPPTHISYRIPDIDDFDPDVYGREIIISESYGPYVKGPRLAFFPPLSKFDPPYPIAPDGYIPNSVVLQKLRKSEEDRLLASKWSPPSLSDRQMKLMDDEKRRRKLREEEEEEEEEDSELMNRLKAAMMEEEEVPKSPTPPPSPPPPEPPKREIKSQMKVEKLVAPKPKPKPPTPPPPSPPPPPPKTPTPPPTPLPDYITQFIGQAWFDKLYPLPNSQTFPKPWTVIRFINGLLFHLSNHSLDYYTKAEIVGAIHKLLNQYGPINGETIFKELVKLLQQGLSTKNFAQRQLIIKILNLLIHMGICPDKALTSCLMGIYSEGDHEVQNLILEYFRMQGVVDPHKYFSKELLTNISHGHQLSKAIDKSDKWLDTWAEDYMHEKEVKTVKKISPKAAALSKNKPPSLPEYNTIDVINYFIQVEHQKELARRRPATPTPPPPPEPSDELIRNAVVPLPTLTHCGRLTRLGDTHCSCCHPERETTLLLSHHHPMIAKQHITNWRTLHLSLNALNINPFLNPQEEQDLVLDYNKKRSLISNTRLFLIDNSYTKL